MAIGSWLVTKVVFYSILLILLGTNDFNRKTKHLNNIRENYRIACDLSRPVFNDIRYLKHRQSTLFTDSMAYYKATKVICLTRDVLLVTILKLCGDVALNPGPARLKLQSPLSKGLKICHWNTQRLTSTKLDEVKISLMNNSNNSNKIAIFCFYQKLFVQKKLLTIYILSRTTSCFERTEWLSSEVVLWHLYMKI